MENTLSSDLHEVANHPQPQPPPSSTPTSKLAQFWLKYKPLLLTLLFLFIIAGVPTLILHYQNKRVMKVVRFIQSKGYMGYFYYVLILTIGTVICIPTTILELASGFIFGMWPSVAVSLIGKCIGSVISFMLGRCLFKKYLRDNVLARYPIIEALEESVENKPIAMILLTRLAFIPMAVKNYGISVIRSVPFNKFTLCTIIGSIPFTLVWSYFGSASQDLVNLAGSEGTGSKKDKALRIAMLVIGILAALVFVFVVRHYTKKHIARLSRPSSAPTSPKGFSEAEPVATSPQTTILDIPTHVEETGETDLTKEVNSSA